MSTKVKYKRLKTSMTTDDRLWRYVAEQAAALHETATNEDISNASKKMRAQDPYYNLRKALKALGVLL